MNMNAHRMNNARRNHQAPLLLFSHGIARHQHRIAIAIPKRKDLTPIKREILNKHNKRGSTQLTAPPDKKAHLRDR